MTGDFFYVRSENQRLIIGRNNRYGTTFVLTDALSLARLLSASLASTNALFVSSPRLVGITVIVNGFVKPAERLAKLHVTRPAVLRQPLEAELKVTVAGKVSNRTTPVAPDGP